VVRRKGFRALHMTIRKKIVLFSALALGAFFVALYLVCRFALLNGFARLESDYARENIHHLQNELTNQQSQLELMSRDYGQWDRTYDFMESKDPDYVRTELTDDTFKIIHINIFLLLDPSGQLVVHQSVGSLTPDAGDLHTITVARLNASADETEPSPVSGVLQLKGRVFLFAYQPILTSRGNGTPRGTLVMGRELDLSLLSSLSRSAGVPLWLEPAEQAPQASMPGTAWSDGTNSARFESDATMLEYVAIKDFYGITRRLLVARVPRSLNLEGARVTRYLLGLLMLVGAIYCGALFFFLEEILLARVALLSTEVSKVTVSGDLSLRLTTGGRDELGTLAAAVNAMLTAIQKTKAELLQAQESLRFHAEHDALTGVLNRRAIRDLLRKELARCRREKNTLGIILADVDHFKKINDRYGHGAGDAVLVTAMQRISSTLRSYDVVGRYGGEEFLIIAPGCDLELAQKLAERIRTAVGDQPVDLGDENTTITLSLGVTLGTAESDPEFLVALADTAMYQAKRNGRNRVEVSLDLPELEQMEQETPAPTR
jgi:diguanylate cyclase (GGDEF)-like protein